MNTNIRTAIRTARVADLRALDEILCDVSLTLPDFALSALRLQILIRKIRRNVRFA